jgi:DNA-binding NarL/FixJ family response regulator
LISLAERILTFANQAPQMPNKKALGNSLLNLIESLGAARYACLYLRREPGGYVIDRSIANVPQVFQQAYLQRGYDSSDPIFQGAVRAGACGFWSEQIRHLDLDADAREVMGVASEHNMKEGFTKRVMLDNGGIAVMMAAGEDMARGDRARAALRMAFDIFANEGARLLKLSNEPRLDAMEGDNVLSRTQMRVLLMRAEGMSNRDIAGLMQRREKTVECHVTEILRRLEARNMIDAIRIATRHKLIV